MSAGPLILILSKKEKEEKRKKEKRKEKRENEGLQVFAKMKAGMKSICVLCYYSVCEHHGFHIPVTEDRKQLFQFCADKIFFTPTVSIRLVAMQAKIPRKAT